jgi:hypothetical protein
MDRIARPAALAGVAFVALAGGAGVGYAATHSTSTNAHDVAAVGASSPSPSATPKPGSGPWSFKGNGSGPFGHGGFRMGPLGFGGFGGGRFGGIVHGQVVVPKSGGGYQTLDVQQGTVTAVSSTSITVKSSDGYTATYAVTSNTTVDAKSAGIGSVKTGDTVDITATVSGSTATAASIMDSTALRAGRASFGFPSGPPSVPSPAPSAPVS